MSGSFTLEYWKDDGWFVGRLLGVPGVFSQGKTLKELKENIRDAYKLMMDVGDADLSIENRLVVP